MGGPSFPGSASLAKRCSGGAPFPCGDWRPIWHRASSNPPGIAPSAAVSSNLFDAMVSGLCYHLLLAMAPGFVWRHIHCTPVGISCSLFSFCCILHGAWRVPLGSHVLLVHFGPNSATAGGRLFELMGCAGHPTSLRHTAFIMIHGRILRLLCAVSVYASHQFVNPFCSGWASCSFRHLRFPHYMYR